MDWNVEVEALTAQVAVDAHQALLIKQITLGVSPVQAGCNLPCDIAELRL
ncbi:hypothetical protein MKD50_00810 [Cupriavidus sp. WGtm5]|nr:MULTISPECIES: hypothetical protein [Cupriavidus]MCO4887898.1 hypothetical protein [Cupriavidus sp. WGtm5]